MTNKQLRDMLACYPDDMEVVLYRPDCEDYEAFFDTYFFIEVNDDNQIVID